MITFSLSSTAFILLFLVPLGAAAGYLARRWHRPVGHRPVPHRVTIAGGAPYVATYVDSADGHYTPEVIAMMTHMHDGLTKPQRRA